MTAADYRIGAGRTSTDLSPGADSQCPLEEQLLSRTAGAGAASMNERRWIGQGPSSRIAARWVDVGIALVRGEVVSRILLVVVGHQPVACSSWPGWTPPRWRGIWNRP